MKLSINLIIVSLISFFILSCANKEEKLQRYKEYVDILSREINYEDGFDNIKIFDEKRSKFRSYYKDDDIVYIKETLDFADRGKSDVNYFYRNNELINYSDKSIVYEKDSTSQKAKKLIKIMLFLDGTDVLESSKFINGQESELFGSEIQNIIEHSQTLRKISLENISIK
jgi:hypothetical protein